MSEETLSLALSVANLAHSDVVYMDGAGGGLTPTEVKAASGSPTGGLPALTVDGAAFAGGNAALRYVGTLAGLVPQDAKQALLADMAMDYMDDIAKKLKLGDESPAAVKYRGENAALLTGLLGKLEALVPHGQENNGFFCKVRQ